MDLPSVLPRVTPHTHECSNAEMRCGGGVNTLRDVGLIKWMGLESYLQHGHRWKTSERESVGSRFTVNWRPHARQRSRQDRESRVRKQPAHMDITL